MLGSTVGKTVIKCYHWSVVPGSRIWTGRVHIPVQPVWAGRVHTPVLPVCMGWPCIRPLSNQSERMACTVHCIYCTPVLPVLAGPVYTPVLPVWAAVRAYVVEWAPRGASGKA